MTVRPLLFLLLLLSQTGVSQQQRFGSRVTRISVTGASISSDAALIPIHPGDVLTPENVRASIQALYDTGRYEYVEADAVSDVGGEAVTFNVRPFRFFSTFRVEPANLLRTPLSSSIRLPIGEKFSETKLDGIVQQMSNLLEGDGYFGATVHPSVQFDDATHLVAVTLAVEAKPRAKLSSIEIRGGADKFSTNELEEKLGLKSGQEFSSERLESGLAKIRTELAGAGYLNSQVTSQKTYDSSTNCVALLVNVEPGQFVQVQVIGYDLPKKKLRATIPIFEEGLVTADLIEEGRVNLRRFLQQQGYYDAVVNAETIQAPGENAVQIKYSVQTGDRHRLETIRIEGNRFFKTDEIQKKLKSQSGGVFNPDTVTQDLDMIRTLYKNAGFEGTTVESHSTDLNHALNIQISIHEGRQYKIDTIGFDGNHGATGEELREVAALPIGSIYKPVAVEQARSAIIAKYYAKGYPDVRAEQEVRPSVRADGVAVTFHIEEGASYKIGKILVAGNTITREKIVHRNSNLYPNTPYDPEVILQTQQKLYATGLFNRVDIVTLPQSLPGVRNILIQVEDAKPILMTYGVGYQDIDGPRAIVELSETNLFGLDRTVAVRLLESKNDQLVRTTFREPRLFNHDLEGDLSGYVEHTRQPQFNADRIDASLQTLKRFSRSESLLFTASFQKINLLDILVNPLADAFPDETGIVHIARLGTSWIHDQRNEPINPRTGSFETATFQVADHAFGSGVNFTSFFDQYVRYKPAGPGVLAGSLRFGWKHPFGDTTVLPITERYFAGGSTTLRGFGLYEAGPIGGGNAETLVNLEYRFPMPLPHLPNLGGAAFYDTGNVFAHLADFSFGDFTHSVGTGLRYETPLGPVRVDFGFNLHPTVRADGTTPKIFHAFFTLGHTF